VKSMKQTSYDRAAERAHASYTAPQSTTNSSPCLLSSSSERCSAFQPYQSIIGFKHTIILRGPETDRFAPFLHRDNVPGTLPLVPSNIPSLVSPAWFAGVGSVAMDGDTLNITEVEGDCILTVGGISL
jgi:hypothetical protein